MVNVSCPECGVTNWLENQSRCFQCGAALRRCIDCAKYLPSQETCSVLHTEVELWEAEKPGGLSLSVNCRRYEPVARRRAA